MIKNLKSKSVLFRCLIAVLTVACLMASYVMVFSKNEQIGIKWSDLEEGTIVKYNIKSDGNIVEAETKTVSKDGKLSLLVPEKLAKSKNNENIEYEISLKQPSKSTNEVTAAQTLNLLVNLDKKSGDIALKAEGIEEFTGLKLRNGQTEKELNADWAGLFETESIRDIIGNTGSNDQIQLAFQNTGIANDIDKITGGKMDVLFSLFGDSSGASTGAIQGSYSNSMAQMAAEISAVMSMQTFMIGKFFDAKMQLTTQRKLQELQARAHKDYHPSDQMCRIGTFMRSVAHTEAKSEVDKKALNRMLLNQYLGASNSATAGTGSTSNPATRSVFARRYCDPKDAGGALERVCEDADVGNAVDIARKNKDIDYARTLGLPLTLDINYTDTTVTGDEEDIFALAKNLYFPNAFKFSDGGAINERIEWHYDSRSFAAKMSVAHSTFLNIVGMKASAPVGTPTTATATSPSPGRMGTGSTSQETGGLITPVRTTRPAPTVLAEDSGWAYMKALIREFGVTSDAEIDQMLGERPSYYAQMEVLTKKIYQHPNFYTNLYDKPANVQRIGASIDAITVMNQRDRYESHLRHEMLSAVLLEEELKRSVEDVNSQIEQAIGRVAQGDL